MKDKRKQIVTIKQLPTERSRALTAYFHDVSNYDMLAPSEETRLIEAYKNGDGDAGEKVVTANLRFVISVAKQYAHCNIPLADLISVGNMGLVKALERFDSSRKFKFISYAVWWIRQCIMMEIMNNSRMIKLPANLHQKNNQYRRLYGEDTPQIAELYVGSYNRRIGDDGMEVVHLLQDDSFDRPDDITMGKTMLHKMVDMLPPRERDIIKLKYGIGHDREYTYDDIIKMLDLDLTRERVRQIHMKALRRLKIHTRHVEKETFLGG